MRRLFSKMSSVYGSWINSKAFEEAIQADRFKVPIYNAELKVKRYTDTLLVSCVDFRFRGAIEKLMRETLHLGSDYDEVVLPGASLAMVEIVYPGWENTIEEVIEVLQKIHHIKRVIFLDHRDCSAYKFIKGKHCMATRELETNMHTEVFQEVRKIMSEKFPTLKVYTLLIDINGVVDNIKPAL